MYRGLRVIAMAPAWNEEEKIGEVVRRTPRELVDEVLVIDDGSTDRTAKVSQELGASVLAMGRVAGVGAALRAGYDHALAGGFDVAVVMAGNNKDSPEEISRLLDPIAEDRADFVQGSRFLGAEANFGPMPLYRKLATRLHPLLFSLVARRWVTESTNGFRAVHRRVLEDERIDLHQAWLDEYELEPYLYLRTIQCGYRTTEAAVTKVYPPRQLGQTKMKPITGWWSILRPLFLVGLGIRK
ncbi:MAG: glycosyltransferase family 2 protein [Deltaproteobacteria bacterium]|nr:glycosyltransferase family 2 protein [Deltaproteobacteria bacterium]MBW2419510.1 glycosyltransferase family 2 protein [Deltaproteobacteria bacterium]